jgi:hypothetical protein
MNGAGDGGVISGGTVPPFRAQKQGHLFLELADGVQGRGHLFKSAGEKVHSDPRFVSYLIAPDISRELLNRMIDNRPIGRASISVKDGELCCAFRSASGVGRPALSGEQCPKEWLWLSSAKVAMSS